MSETHLTEQRFSEFTLEEPLQRGLQDAGFVQCTPIQAACLPAALEGRDVAGQAQTGTGKTVAFLLACCHYLLTHPPHPRRALTQPRALILAPTRELAIQIHQDAQVLARHTGITLGLVYGGTGYDSQKEMLAEGVDMLIGTPGRLIDFFKQGLYDLQRAQVAVLDEADRMFDLGFIRDIRFLLRRMPPPGERLNLLFSATLSFKVMELAYEHMNDPEEIKIEGDTVVVDKVTEYCFYPANEEKLPLLVNLLKRDNHERILVFVNTRIAVEKLAAVLSANGISNGALSGDVPQRKREQLLEAFKSGKRKVLVATDVAARGLHIPDVTHVYNFDLPQDADDYIHRIGRTARAGASGEAISFVCERYAYSIMEIEEGIGHALPRNDIGPELLEAIQTTAMTRARNGREARGARGARGGGKIVVGNVAAAKVAGNAAANAPPAASAVETPVKTPAETPVETPAKTPVETSVETSVKTSVETPAETPVETPVETSVKTPVETSVKTPVETSVKTPAAPIAPQPAAAEQPAPPPTSNRFSRRYGEVPAIG